MRIFRSAYDKKLIHPQSHGKSPIFLGGMVTFSSVAFDKIYVESWERYKMKGYKSIYRYFRNTILYAGHINKIFVGSLRNSLF